METSQPLSLSIDSFSYSWLVNVKPSSETPGNSFRTSLDESDEASFIEMDPRMPPSKRFFRKSQDFKFDFPVSPSSLTSVHADQLISNGYLMPLFIDPVKMQAFEASDCTVTGRQPLISSNVAKNTDRDDNSDCSSLRKCKRLTKKILEKYLNFFRPLCRRIRRRKASCKMESDEYMRRSRSVNNLVYSCDEISPRISVAYSDDNWRKSCDSESSIYEAVLYCKKSRGE